MQLSKATIGIGTAATIVLMAITYTFAYASGNRDNDVKNNTQDSRIQSSEERITKLEAGFQSMATSLQRVSESNVEVKTELKNVAQNVNDMRLDLKDYIMSK